MEEESDGACWRFKDIIFIFVVYGRWGDVFRFLMFVLISNFNLFNPHFVIFNIFGSTENFTSIVLCVYSCIISILICFYLDKILFFIGSFILPSSYIFES